MSKGQYPAARNGKIVGHYMPVEDGRGWVYVPLPPPIEWIELGDAADKGQQP